MKKKLSLMFTLILVTIVALSACGSSEQGGGGEGKYGLVESGKLTFVSSGEFPPFSKMNEEGKMVGYDVAVGKAVAKELGLEPNPEKYKFASIIAGIEAGRFDAGVASHTITEKRDKAVDFTEPYYYSGPQIFTQPGSDIKTAEDLKGIEIAVSKGSTYFGMAKKYTDKIKTYASDLTALRALAKGKHDAVITDIITGKTAIDKGLKVKGQEVLGVSKQAIVVNEDNDKLRKAISEALKNLKESGKLKELSMKWIGVDITQPPKQK